MRPEPLFYNQVSYLAFKKSLLDVIKLPDEGVSSEVTSLTYEEENAIRFYSYYLLMRIYFFVYITGIWEDM